MTIHKEEFTDLVEEYSRLVVTLCFSFTKNYFEAEDLAQETFLSAYRSLGQFDGKNPKAWLTVIAANKCRDYLKSSERKVLPLTEETGQTLPDGRASPEETVVRADTERRIALLCGRLREPYRVVATAYFCEQRPLSELAVQTGASLRTLQTQLYRAKKLLKDLWKEEFP